MLSRSLVLLALSLATYANGKEELPKTRKSLGWGLHKPHARFVITPQSEGYGKTLLARPISHKYSKANDIDAASSLIQSLLPKSDDGEHGYRIRSDSYHDSTTGLTHVYAKQTYKGLDVEDGNVNVNVRKGVVVSFGDQFYHPAHAERNLKSIWASKDLEGYLERAEDFMNPIMNYQLALHELAHGARRNAHAAYIRFLAQDKGSQLLKDLKQSNPVNPLHYILSSWNPQPDYPGSSFSKPQDPMDFVNMDPRESILSFMIQAAPNEEFEADLRLNKDTHFQRMEYHAQDHLWGNHEDGIGGMITNVPGVKGEVKARLVWVQTGSRGTNDGLEAAWKFHVEMEDNYYDALVSAQYTASILSVVDWVSDSQIPFVIPNSEEVKKPLQSKPEPALSDVDPTYLVFPWGVNDPSEGNRTILKMSKSADKLASPFGWHQIPVNNVPDGIHITSYGKDFAPVPGKGKLRLANFTTTVGNNVYAQENFEGQNSYTGNYRPSGSGNLSFVYEYAPKDGEDKEERMKEARKHINATITQLFYTTNGFHDLLYRYGFHEESGNFQAYNFGRGGREGDAVIANAQDGSGFNNANFMTPPDGTSGRMRMYLWNTASPYRDGDFEAGIVIHELAHGLSTRLTGGPADSSCLGWGESGGMGEGWGDFLATTIRSGINDTEFPMGAWAANTKKGIRNYPYSLNLTVNPETYKSVDKYFGVHPIGEVWAEILWVVSQRLIAKHGFSETLFPPAPLENGTIPEGDFYRPRNSTGDDEAPLIPRHGNTLIVQLVVTGMKLQPCRPGFLEARDAIIQADQLLTGGENLCELWDGFANRGLGVHADVFGKTPWGGGQRKNDFTVPTTCPDKA